LRHDDKAGVEFVLHIDRGPVAGDGLVERYDLQPGTLGFAFAFDRLVVDPNAGDPCLDALPDHAADGHDAAMPCIAIHHDGEGYAAGDPSGYLDAFRKADRSDIGHPGVAANDATGSNETNLATLCFHNPSEGGCWGVHDGKDLALAVDQLL
jgi:hypothetical protein